jgi:hypothetical protein
MANHFLTGEKEGLSARRFIPFGGDDQNVFKKGDQIQSVIPLDQMRRSPDQPSRSRIIARDPALIVACPSRHPIIASPASMIITQTRPES